MISQAEASDEPLKLEAVEIPPAARGALRECWRRQKGKSLYRSEDEFVEFVKQVQCLRLKLNSCADVILAPVLPLLDLQCPLFCPLICHSDESLRPHHPHFKVLSRDIRALHKRLGTSQQQDDYHVILEGCDVSYDVAEGGRVVIKGAVRGGTGGRVMLAVAD